MPARSRAIAPRSPDFFISYSGNDLKWAKWIAWELENARPRYRCLAQFKDFAPGMDFVRRMREGAEAGCTLALFSPHYFKSRYCERELHAALAGEPNRLLPVRIAPCDPGNLLRSCIHIDLAGKPLDEARSLLLSGVEAYLTQTRAGQGKPAFRQRPDFPGGSQEQAPARARPAARAGGVLKVLFLGPEVGGLAPREQLGSMERSVAKAMYPPSVRFKGVFRVTANTLFDELNRESPHVFHFSGKQSGGDILMRTENGGLTTVSDMALAGMLRSLDAGLKLVIIDTCYSLPCATTIARAVPCAIGVQGDIYEDDATRFYAVLYQAIASGRSLKDAVAQASARLKFAKVPAARIPQLRCRPGTDPGKVFLVRPGRDGAAEHPAEGTSTC